MDSITEGVITIPNWCRNDVTITSYPPGGGLEEVANFLARKEANGNLITFCYDEVIPQPPEVLASLEYGEGDVDWYDWRVMNWGTKWDNTEDVYTEISGDCLYYSFGSPWSPPQPVMRRLSELFPHIVVAHAWDEPGSDFGGFKLWHKGEVLQQRSGSSRMDSYHDLAGYALDDTSYLIEKAHFNNEDLPLEA